MLLNEYIRQNEITQQSMADKLKITISHFRMIMLGKSSPSRRLAIDIEIATEGAVTKSEAIFFEEKK